MKLILSLLCLTLAFSQELKSEECIEQSGCPLAFVVYDADRKPDYPLKVLRINLGLTSFQKIVIDVNNVYLLNNEGKTIERIN